MGWTNFIIIPKLKLIIEIRRQIDEIPNYQKNALNFLTDEERIYEIEEYDIENKYTKDLTVKDLTQIFSVYEQANNISGMESDKFFLYWLETKGIDYEIESGFVIKENNKLESYKNDGYTILRMFESKELIT